MKTAAVNNTARKAHGVVDGTQGTKERWKALCEQATTEEDPTKLLKLISEIDELLAQKQDRLVTAKLPEYITVGPTTLICPRCHANPGIVCEVLFGDELEIVHVE